MLISTNVIYGLLGILCGVSVLAFIFSWSSTRGVTIKSCKGDSTACGCDGHKEGLSTAEKILSLIKEE